MGEEADGKIESCDKQCNNQLFHGNHLIQLGFTLMTVSVATAGAGMTTVLAAFGALAFFAGLTAFAGLAAFAGFLAALAFFCATSGAFSARSAATFLFPCSPLLRR